MENDLPSGSPRRRSARIFGAAAVLLLIAVGLLILSIVQTRRPASTLRQNGFLDISGPDVVYSAAGNGLAVASAERIALYSAAGKCVAEENLSFSSPLCVGSALLGVYYDAGHAGLYALYPDGTSQYTDTDGDVSFVDVNETGLVTVLLEKSDTRGCVIVYDTDLTPLFRWDAGSSLPLIARSYGDDLFCVSCFTREGSALHFFRIDQTKELGELSLEDELIIDFDFLSDGTLAAVSDRRLILSDTAGQITYTLSFNDSHLASWSLNGGFAVIHAVSASEGGSGVITAVAPNGEILGSCSAPRHVEALSSGKDECLALFTGGEAALYDSALTELVCYQPDVDVDQIFLTPNGMAFFAGPQGVTLVDFGR